MYQEIEKLKQEREKLNVEYQNSQSEYKSEIKRINKAIRSFEKGISELNGTSAAKEKRPKTSSTIEQILSETGPLKITELAAKLNERGVPMKYQSLSGILQLYSKAGKKFVKTAPATYGLLESVVAQASDQSGDQTDNQNSIEQTVIYEEDLTATKETGGIND